MGGAGLSGSIGLLEEILLVEVSCYFSSFDQGFVLEVSDVGLVVI